MSSPLNMTFDNVADLYNAARPRYAVELVDAVCSVLPPTGARILEIGCGTGQATALFARRGHNIVALEPGSRLASLAAANLGSFPGVDILTATFEDWDVEANRFDMVMSATAFHWVTPEVRCVKSSDALAGGGWLSLFWNIADKDESPTALRLQGVYDACMPSNQPSHPYRTHNPAWSSTKQTEKVQRWVVEIDESSRFGPVAVSEFRWSETYTIDRYLHLLETYSDHRTLPLENKQRLFDGITEVLADNGNRVEKRYLCVLYLAQKRG